MIALAGELFPLLGIAAAVLGAWFIHRIAERVRLEERGVAPADPRPAGSSQPVGKSCTVCGRRIATVLEGDFCPDCDLPVHFRCESNHGCFQDWSNEDQVVEEGAEVSTPVRGDGEKERDWVGLRNPALMWGLWYLFLGVPLVALGVTFFVYACVDRNGGFVARGLWIIAGLVTLGGTLTMRGVKHLRWMRDD